jgi:hypothetical protein
MGQSKALSNEVSKSLRDLHTLASVLSSSDIELLSRLPASRVKDIATESGIEESTVATYLEGLEQLRRQIR